MSLLLLHFHCQQLRTIQTISTAQTSDRSQSDLNRTKPTHLSNRNRTQDHKPPLSTPPLSFPLPLSVHLSSRVSSRSLSTKHTHALSPPHCIPLSLLSTRALMRHTPSCSSLLHCVSLHAPPSLRAARSILHCHLSFTPTVTSYPSTYSHSPPSDPYHTRPPHSYPGPSPADDDNDSGSRAACAR